MFTQQKELVPSLKLTQQRILNRGENVNWEKTRFEKVMSQHHYQDDGMSFTKDTEVTKSLMINNEELSEIDSSRGQSVDSRDREIAEKSTDGFKYNTAALLYRANKLLNDPLYDHTLNEATEDANHYRDVQLEKGRYHGRNIQKSSEQMRNHLYSFNYSPQEAEDFINRKLRNSKTEFSYEQHQNDDSQVLEYSFESEQGGNYGQDEENGYFSPDIEDTDAILVHEFMKRGYTFELAKQQSASVRQLQVKPSTNIVTPSENFHISPPSFIGSHSVGDDLEEDRDVAIEIQRIMALGFTREHAIKMQHQESLRRLSRSGQQAFNKMGELDDIPVSSLKSKSAERAAIIVDRKSPEVHLTPPLSKPFLGNRSSNVERTPFQEDTRSINPPLSTSPSTSPSSPQDDVHVEYLMSLGYTKEQAIKMQHQVSLRRLSLSGQQAFNKMGEPGDIPVSSLRSKSAERAAIIVDRKSPEVHLTPPLSKPFLGTSSSKVERNLFQEDTRSINPPLSISSSASPSSPQDDIHVEYLMSLGYTREQAVRNQQQIRSAQRPRNLSNHISPNTVVNIINRSADSIGTRDREASPGSALSVPIDPMHFNNFPVVEPAVESAIEEEARPAFAIDLDYIRQRQYPPCYYSLQLDNDEALEVGKWISRYKDISREGAIYLLFQDRMHASWPAISAFKSRRALANQMSADERALEMGILLSEQTRHFRMNMYEMLERNPHDQIGLEVLMEMGLSYDDAVLFLFENRVVFYTAVPSGNETINTTTAAAVAVPVATTTASPPNVASPDNQQEPSIWQRLFRSPAWFRPSSPSRRRQQQQQQQLHQTPPQQSSPQQQHLPPTPPLAQPSSRRYASPPQRTPNQTPPQQLSPQHGHASSPESVTGSNDDYLNNMRRVLKYERVKRRDVEAIMGLTCATEVQVVHALLATDCVVQDAVHLLLNTT